MLDNSSKNIAERAWAGEILLPDTPHEFYGMLACAVQMHPEMSFASTTITYTPKPNSRRRVAVSMGYSYGHQHDGQVLDIPQRIAKSVEFAYNRAYSDFYLEPKIELLHIASRFISSIRTPRENELLSITGDTQAHLYALCNRFRTSALTAQRQNLIDLMESILRTLNADDTAPSKISVLLFAGFKNFALIPERGMEQRLERAVSISPVLKMLACIGHPNINSDVLRCIKHIEEYNKQEE